MFLAVAIAPTDLVFALDSVPAIFGITAEPYLVFRPNVFEVMGLHQVDFLRWIVRALPRYLWGKHPAVSWGGDGTDDGGGASARQSVTQEGSIPPRRCRQHGRRTDEGDVARCRWSV